MILPVTNDRETEPFFTAAAEGRLSVKTCDECGRGNHPPVPHCPYCGSAKTAWRGVAGRGTLHAWTTVTHQVHPSFPVPFTIVVVQLDEAPEVRLVGRLDGQPDLRVGDPMQVWFESTAEGVVLPNWRPAEEDAHEKRGSGANVAGV